MKIYKVKESYIDYLRKSEPKVLENKQEKRPYLGVALQVNSYNYFVPLSSPKPKHKTMKNTKDFQKIDGGKYGAINFNKIIPIKIEYLIEYNILQESDIQYKLLLQNQQKILKTMKDTIKTKTNNIYDLFNTPDDKLTPSDIRVKRRCCNFKLLEKLCDTYIN